MKRIVNKIFIKLMNLFGYSSFATKKILKGMLRDIRQISKGVTIKEIIWAWRRGFFVESIKKYDLCEGNYKDYMPDFEYYQTYPINGGYSKWIDDKLIINYILRPFDEFLPKYYYRIERGIIYKLMNCTKNYDQNIESVIRLLKKEGNLAVKLIAGSLGNGFCKLSFLNGHFYINNEKKSESEIHDFVDGLENHIITEYVFSHNSIRRINDLSANTLRIMVVNDDNIGPKIVGAFFKYGTKSSGVIEHIHAGGVLCKVELESGRITMPFILEGNKKHAISVHPDNGLKLNGWIPNWDFVVDKIIKISKYINSVKYIGYDVVITDKNFKLLELNSHQGINLMQIYYPLFKNEHYKQFFINIFNKKYKQFKRVLNIIDT